MAIFFQGNLPAIVWDAKLKKEKFAFCKRVLKTNSKSLIKMLTDYGYERSEDITKEEQKVTVATTLDGNEIGETITSSGQNKRIRLKKKE